MGALVIRCGECGFENPRRWVGCARCGRLLGPNPAVRGMGGEADPSTDPTRHAPAEMMSLVAQPSAVHDDDHTRLFHSPATIADARPVVGQEALLQLLRQNVEVAFSQRKVSVSFIEGETGMGRTRLLERISELVAQQWMSARVMYATCRTGEDGPYAPFSRCLLERFGVSPASSPSMVRAAMLEDVQAALPEAEANEALEVTHLLGHVAGIPFPASAVLSSLAREPAELQERACSALRRLIEGDARGRPLLLLLDDMQRAENEAFRMLEALLAVEGPLAIVIAGDQSCAGAIEQLSTILPAQRTRIRPLGDAEVSELVLALVPGLRETPEPFVAALRHRCDGNPSELRELLRVLEERGMFKPGPDGTVALDLSRFERGELPLTMTDAVRARLAALEAFELTVMKWACVVGELFWDGALLAIARSCQQDADVQRDPLQRWTETDDDKRLGEALLRLQQKRFIVRLTESQVPGLSEYTFQFAGTRAVIYAELSDYTRREHHAVVARFMTMAQRLPSEGSAAQLAHHLERAGQRVPAAEAYLRAATEEQARLRTTMALRHAQKALSLVSSDEIVPRLEALHAQGSLLTTLGRYDDAYAAFTEIADLAWRLGARGAGGAALNRLARIHRQRGEHGQALDYLRCALTQFRAAEDARGVASTYDDLAQVHRVLGNLEPALAAAQDALASRRASEDARGEAVSLTTIGFIELDQGGFDNAKRHFEAALAIYERIADHEGMIQTRIGGGKLAFYQGRIDDAVTQYEAALASAREMNNRRFQCHLLNHLAEASIAQGRHDDAERQLRDAQKLALRLRDQRALAEIEHNLALLALERGDASAEARLASALAAAHEYGAREAIATAHRGMARLRARSLFDQTGRANGDAESSFREAIRVFEECGNVREVARTRAELGYHLIERGAAPRAKEALTQAQAVMEGLALPELQRVTETLAQL